MSNSKFNQKAKSTKSLGNLAILVLSLILLLPTTTLASLPTKAEIAKPIGTDKQLPKSVPLAAGTIQFERSGYTLNEDHITTTQYISLTRTGGTDGAIRASLILTNTTTSEADYTLLPSNFITSFDTPAVRTPQKFTLQPDGKILVTNYQEMGSDSHYKLTRLNPDYSIDTSFVPPATFYGGYYVMDLQSDGKNFISPRYIDNDYTHVGVTRLNPDGSVDPSFVTSASLDIDQLITQANGKLIIRYYNYSLGYVQAIIARLNTDGSFDASFPAYTFNNITITDMALQSDGKIVVTGYQRYTPFIARLNSNGTLDASFQTSGLSYIATQLIVQSDDKILIHGQALNITRLNTDGTLDTNFVTPDFTSNNGKILSLQTDGKILVAQRSFESYSHTYSHLSRLDPNGMPDTSFVEQNVDFTITAVTTTNNGEIIFGGYIDETSRSSSFLHIVNPNLQVSFANGEGGTKTIALTVNNDTLSENDETLQLSLANPTGGAILGTNTTVTATIIDNDLAATNLSLSSAYNIANLNQSVVFTASLSSLTPGLTAVPTGLVTFKEADNTIGTANLDPNGVAILTINTLSVGTHHILATYAGDAKYINSSSNTLSQLVTNACSPVMVSQALDDGSGNTTATLSYALTHITDCPTINFALTSTNNTMTLTGSLVPAVPSGIIIDGGNNQVSINGNGVTGDGLRLSGNNTLRNLTIRGFAGREIVLNGTGNRLIAVRIQN